MITFSKLGRHGQLGNQLFQVALLLGVSAKTGFEIAIPKTFKGTKKKDLVELQPFRITAHALINSHNSLRKFNKYQETEFPFNPAVFNQPDKTDYAGYFQTEKYFTHAEDKVREEFRFQPDIERYAGDYIFQQRDSLSVVAVHVRRGDYTERPDVFRVLTPEYYKRAMNHPALPKDKQFLVFSDDIPWCRENLKDLTDHKTWFAQSPSHWYDLALMTFCDAHIISGSSFSWWGAWLCHNRPNPVIAPTPWFANGNNRWDTRDIVPDRWIQLEV